MCARGPVRGPGRRCQHRSVRTVPWPHAPHQQGAVDTVDALVVGGGASGLSLVCHLAAAGWHGDVLLVDDGAVPPEAPAWAYWSRGGGLLDGVASPGSDRLRVRGPGLDRTLDLGPYRYRTITGPRLRRAADLLLAGAPGTRRMPGRVTEVRPDEDGALVRVDPLDGGAARTVRARWVFDSVGPEIADPCPTDTPHLAFLGLRVECDEDVFDPAVPTLMDFRTDQSAGLAFLYVLPTSPRAALVEHTRFVVPDGRPRPEAGHHEALRRALADLGASHHRVVGVERGTIPLHVAPPARPVGCVVPLGTRAGMVKASTGYGFDRIQRHSAHLARSLVRRGHPFDVPRPDRWHRALDALLLEVVRDEPEAVVGVFSRLFARNPAERVLAFLDEDTTLVQELLLFGTLPVAPYRRAVVRRLRRAERAPADGSASRTGAAVSRW